MALQKYLLMGAGGLILVGTAQPLEAQVQDSTTNVIPVSQQDQSLLLGVVINNYPAGTVATFRRLANGKLAATPGDLETAGIRPETGKVGADGLIPLDSLAGVSWNYDEPGQRVLFTAPDAARVPNSIDIGAKSEKVDFTNLRSDPGFLLNYTLYGTSGWNGGASTSLSGDFDARLLTPFGTGSTTALARINNAFSNLDDRKTDFVRLDSSWRYTDPEHAIVYQIGDIISGSLSWNTAYRLGGIQIKRNFNIRPDLITTPVPDLSGSAAVPSTLDLYVNNIRVFSGDVPAGPFAVKGLPFLGGGGDARIVMRDVLGREVVTQRAYFFAPSTLGKGYLDFSSELGVVRRNYGNESFSYDQDPAGSISLRYGLTDWMTLEGQAEATRGLVNGGVGFVTSLGPFGSVNASFATSRFDHGDRVETGSKLSGYYQISYKGYAFYMGADRSLGDYNDVGLVADRRNNVNTPLAARARAVDRIGVTVPLGFDPSALSLSFSRIRDAGKDGNSSLLSASWSRIIFDRASLYVTGYADLDKHRGAGIFAGLVVPLGKDYTVSTAISNDGIDTSLTKSARLQEGAFSWSLRDHESFKGSDSRSASANYRTSRAELSGSIDQSGDKGRVTGTVDGSLVMAGGGVFLANRVDDAFAVVKGGGPNADVTLNGSRVATTNSSGRAFVPSLRSYENNRIEIDPANLPLDLQPDATRTIIVPADRAATVVDFGTKKVDGATVVLTDANGNPLPLGSEVRLDRSGKTTVVGYDGRVWLTGLDARNSLTVTLPEAAGTCQASFAWKAAPGTQPDIGIVSCR